MIKTTKRGSLKTTFRLMRFSTHSTIQIMEQNGRSLKNEWGGYPVMHTGQPAYIEKRWKAL